jgi:hypothetical protein
MFDARIHSNVIPHALVLVFLATTPLAARADDFTAPPPRMIELLQREHRARDWWIVTTPEGRVEARVGDVGATGLALTQTRRGAPTNATLAWSRIERIERRHSRHRLGQVLGAVAGATALGYLGAAIDNADAATASEVEAAWVGVGVGAVAGGWLGGRLGDQLAHTTPLYVAPARQPGAAPDAPMPAAAALLQDDAGRTVLRIRGSFGEVAGRAAVIDAQGIAGIEPDPRFDSGGALPEQPLRWEEITQVERLDVATRRYAWTGGAIGAAVFATLGGFIAGSSVGLSSGGDSRDVLGGMAVGAGLGGAVGALMGGMLGSRVQTWDHVYVATPIADAASP